MGVGEPSPAPSVNASMSPATKREAEGREKAANREPGARLKKRAKALTVSTRRKGRPTRAALLGFLVVIVVVIALAGVVHGLLVGVQRVFALTLVGRIGGDHHVDL